MKRVTAEWVKKSENDLRLAKLASESTPPLHDGVGFNCQQAAEKYLKALLEELGEAIPKTHDLIRLLNLLLPHDPGLKSLRRGLDRLSRYAADYRYPGMNVTGREAKTALRVSERVRQAVRKCLGLDKPKPS